MRLTDLNPRWVMKDGVRMGLLYLCPCCVADPSDKQDYLFTAIVPFEKIWCQYDLIKENGFFEDEKLPSWRVVPSRAGFAWTVAPGATEFENLTLTPSVDASASGNWHGFITNGLIV